MPTSPHHRRLNVWGFLHRPHDLSPSMMAGKVDTPVIVQCFAQCSKQSKKRTSVWLDNSPLHRSHEFMRHRPQWVKRGLMIQYLPPYSPELHLIEILWRFINYHWWPFSAYKSLPWLVQAVEDILTRFGTDYTRSFQATRV